MLRCLLEALAPYERVLHVDSSVDLRAYLGEVGPVVEECTIVDDRVEVKWGALSGALAMKRILGAAAAVAGPMDHVVLLSGQCFPIGGVDRVVDFLRSRPLGARQFCRAVYADEAGGAQPDRVRLVHDLERYPVGAQGLRRYYRAGRRRSQAFFSRTRNRPVNIPRFRIAMGSQWIALTRECIDDLLGVNDGPLLEHLRYSFAADEMYVHTLLHNSSWSAQTQLGGVESGPCSHPASELWNLHLIHRGLGSYLYQDSNTTRESLLAAALGGRYFVRKVDHQQSHETIRMCQELADHLP
jgi:hypothetical protein